MKDLEQLQYEINQCDDQIISILTKKFHKIQEMTRYKKANHLPIFDKQPPAKTNILENAPFKGFKEEISDIISSVEKNSKKVQAKSLVSENIMLIGFMGCGKSTISAYLNKMLAMEVVEMDALIVEKEGMSINDIFAKHGEEYFRNCESNLLIELQKQNQLVVSCGGGVVLREENVAHMKKNGKIVLLQASPETIYARVKNSTDRPILNNNMNVEFISELMEKRKEKYLKAADIVIDTDNKTVQEICEELIEKISK